MTDTDRSSPAFQRLDALLEVVDAPSYPDYRVQTDPDVKAKLIFESYVQNVQKLVEALEAGGYNSAPSRLCEGQPLIVEDLNPTMHVTTFAPNPTSVGYLRDANRCFRLAKIARFFRLHSWAWLFQEAGAHFKAKAGWFSPFSRIELEAKSTYHETQSS
jgi:hypothetical protein